jgi:hypothetical protein
MSATPPLPFSDYIVFVDETGDHGMTSINRVSGQNCGATPAGRSSSAG